MALTEEAAVDAYARMLNSRDISHFEPLLADNIEFVSEVRLEPVKGKQAFVELMTGKLEGMRNRPVWSETGSLHMRGKTRPCAFLSQYNRENLVGAAVCEIKGDKVSLIHLFFPPAPDTVKRSGEYPGL